MERGRYRNRVNKAAAGIAALFLLFGAAFFVQAADYGIEQVNVNMPEVVAYYTMGDSSDILEDAALGSDILEIESQVPFTETGESVEYHILLDVSKSVDETDFREALAGLVDFKKNLRSGDKMILYTFGDEVRTPILNGNESVQAAEEIINGISRESMNTYLIQAVVTTVEDIGKTEEEENERNVSDRTRRVVIVISDGFDDADSTVGRYTAVSTLQAAGIPVHKIALNASLQRSDEEKKSRRAELNDIANSTGGIPWSVDMAESVSMSQAFADIQDVINSEYCAVMKAPTNKVSDRDETLTLSFMSGKTAKRSVTVSRHLSDTTAPTAQAYEQNGRICISFSESVTGATDRNNYLVTHEGKNLVIARASDISDSPLQTVVELTFENDPLDNGSYDIKLSGIKDNSEEANVLTASEMTVEITGGKELDKTKPTVTGPEIYGKNEGFLVHFSEDVKNAADNGNYKIIHYTDPADFDKESDDKEIIPVSQAIYNDKDFSATLLPEGGLKDGYYDIEIQNIQDTSGNKIEKTTVHSVEITGQGESRVTRIVNLILKWLPLILLAVVALFILLFVRIMRKIKGNSDSVVVRNANGDLVQVDVDAVPNEEGKIEVKVAPAQPRLPITVWINNGSGDAKRVDSEIIGSMIVGRAAGECDIYCDDKQMSKQHFMLSLDAGEVFVTDLESTNGTSLNGILINGSERVLSGDTITAGNLNFRIEW